MKTVFRLKHARGRGFIDFDDYGPLLLANGPHSEWIAFVLRVNEHGVVMSEEQLDREDLTSERLWFLKRGQK